MYRTDDVVSAKSKAWRTCETLLPTVSATDELLLPPTSMLRPSIADTKNEWKELEQFDEIDMR